MPPWDEIARGIGGAIASPFAIEATESVGGGCINRCYVVRGRGRAYFVKLNEPARLPMFEAEAAGLAEIARSATVRVPTPTCSGANQEASWLAVEYIELHPARSRSHWELGRQLSRMHKATNERFGWHRDNTIGATPQVNTPHADWISFWRENRLGFQLELAARNGHRGLLQQRGERLLEELSGFFVGYTPTPSLLHGDLWGGNAAFDTEGAPVVFDPAVYYGDREADIAMTELFGGFGSAFYSAYRDEFPLDAGYARRRDLYNLYHVLNHLNLFGGGYGAQALRMIDQLLDHA
ncbi:MAG TPA: fructosamine kinase family protein [Burkholderiales bacterium]|nr:fructosamine kinase family protein [Burkholderiales bacterium]